MTNYINDCLIHREQHRRTLLPPLSPLCPTYPVANQPPTTPMPFALRLGWTSTKRRTTSIDNALASGAITPKMERRPSCGLKFNHPPFLLPFSTLCGAMTASPAFGAIQPPLFAFVTAQARDGYLVTGAEQDIRMWWWLHLRILQDVSHGSCNSGSPCVQRRDIQHASEPTYRGNPYGWTEILRILFWYESGPLCCVRTVILLWGFAQLFATVILLSWWNFIVCLADSEGGLNLTMQSSNGSKSSGFHAWWGNTCSDASWDYTEYKNAKVLGISWFTTQWRDTCNVVSRMYLSVLQVIRRGHLGLDWDMAYRRFYYDAWDLLTQCWKTMERQSSNG